MIENKKKPNPIDIHVGSRIRLRRTMLGMSQEKLGESLGITFQQIQKYEKGTNRVSISTLKLMCKVMDCHPMDIIGEGDDVPASAAPLVDLATENAKLRRAVQPVRKIVGGYVERLGIDDIDHVSATAEPQGIPHAAQTH